jgi:hypothetical protein
MSDFYLLITDAGKSLETAAHASGNPVKLTDFSVGDGNGSPVTPDAAQTSLVNETFRDAISSLAVSISDSTVLEAECVIPASSGGYTIREIGIFADDGSLYAVGNFAEQEKPDPDSGYAASLQILADLAVSDTADITLTIQDGSYLTEPQGDTLYLRQDKNLSEIAAQGTDAQGEARDNLDLGTAAIADTVTSPEDTTAGSVLVVGSAGIGKAIRIAPGSDVDLADFMTTANGNFYHCDSPYTNAPPWFGTEWFDIIITQHEAANYRTIRALSSSGHTAFAVITAGTFSGWKRDYTELQKPSAADTGAVPLNSDGSVDAIKTLRCQNFQTPQTGTPFEFAQLSGIAGNVYFDIHTDGSASGEDYSYRITYKPDKSATTSGQWIPGDYANFDARYYTQTAANAKFVTQIRLGAYKDVTNSSGNVGEEQSGYVVTMGGDFGSDNGYYRLRKMQYLINGAWYDSVSS